MPAEFKDIIHDYLEWILAASAAIGVLLKAVLDFFVGVRKHQVDALQKQVALLEKRLELSEDFRDDLLNQNRFLKSQIRQKKQRLPNANALTKSEN